MNFGKYRTLRLLTLCCLVMPVSAYAAGAKILPFTREQTAAKIDAYMQGIVNEHQFSGAVLVAQQGQLLLSSGYGMANIELAVANTPHTKFRLGSLTKQFTAMAILILQEENKLRVSDTICTYISNCPIAWLPITIHQLLTHTAGIQNHPNITNIFQPVTAELAANLIKDLPLDFVPGTGFNYSNAGYNLLGLIIEKTSGQAYEEFLRQKIFNPLHMSQSGYDHTSTILADRAAGYEWNNGVLLNAAYMNMTIPYAAGGLYSTVEDLWRWDQALYSERLVGKASLKAAFTPYRGHYGYGWDIDVDKRHPAVLHSGRIPGFSTFIGRHIKDQLTVVVLANIEDIPAEKIGQQLFELARTQLGPQKLDMTSNK